MKQATRNKLTTETQEGGQSFPELELEYEPCPRWDTNRWTPYEGGGRQVYIAVGVDKPSVGHFEDLCLDSIYWACSRKIYMLKLRDAREKWVVNLIVHLSALHKVWRVLSSTGSMCLQLVFIENKMDKKKKVVWLRGCKIESLRYTILLWRSWDS